MSKKSRLTHDSGVFEETMIQYKDNTPNVKQKIKQRIYFGLLITINITILFSSSRFSMTDRLMILVFVDVSILAFVYAYWYVTSSARNTPPANSGGQEGISNESIDRMMGINKK